MSHIRKCPICETPMNYWYTEDNTGYEWFICSACGHRTLYHPSEVQE